MSSAICCERYRYTEESVIDGIVASMKEFEEGEYARALVHVKLVGECFVEDVIYGEWYNFMAKLPQARFAIH